MDLEKFFNPKSVAVIGASSDPAKVGYALVKNLSENPQIQIHRVNLENKEIPAGVDLAIIAVRADLVPSILEECGNKKIKNAIIISSGFKEVGEEGKKLEDDISRIAGENGISVLGPNCLGVIDTKNCLNASFSAQKPRPGKIAFLSQSGALGSACLDWALGEGVGFSKFISLGNEAVLTEIDFLRFLAEDAQTEAVMIYLEKINDGAGFMEALKSVTSKKPVVLLKAGTSDYGARAVMSHTGSLAPAAEVFESAVKQSGAMVVSSVRKFFNMAKIFSVGCGVKEPVKNMVVLTNGGGPSVVAADEIGFSKSLSLLTLTEDAKNKLKEVLPKMAAVSNPVDIIGDADADRYQKSLEILCDIPEVEGIIVMLTPQMMTDAQKVAEVLVEFKDKKKIFPVFMGGTSIDAGKKVLTESGLVNFSYSKDVITGLDILTSPLAPLLDAGEGKKKETPPPSLTKSSLEQIQFPETVKILNDYGIKISGNFIDKKEELGGVLESLGQGPYAMKAISKEAVHKTEAGTIRLDIRNFDEASRAWEELWTTPQVMGNVEGILIQRMIGSGPALAKASAAKEVIIGMKRDAVFGPALLFGMGGIFAEAIKDTSMRIAPVEKEEALKMMREIKNAKILEGMRGELPVNFDALAEIVVSLSKLALDHPEIKEIDLNPVICSGDSVVVVDARIMK